MSRLVMKDFTFNGSWVAPAGVTQVYLIGFGGGSGGSGGRSWVATQDNALGGTGCAPYMLTVTVVPNTSYSITIGAGGTGGVARTATGTNGGTGGNSTFGALATFQGAAQAATQTGSNTLTTTSRPFQSFYWNQTSVTQAGFLYPSFGYDFPQVVRNGIAGNGANGTNISNTTQLGGLGGCPGYTAGGAGGNAANGSAGQVGTAGAANSGSGGGGGGQGSTGGAGGAGGSGRIWVMWVE